MLWYHTSKIPLFFFFCIENKIRWKWILNSNEISQIWSNYMSILQIKLLHHTNKQILLLDHLFTLFSTLSFLYCLIPLKKNLNIPKLKTWAKSIQNPPQSAFSLCTCLTIFNCFAFKKRVGSLSWLGRRHPYPKSTATTI